MRGPNCGPSRQRGPGRSTRRRCRRCAQRPRRSSSSPPGEKRTGGGVGWWALGRGAGSIDTTPMLVGSHAMRPDETSSHRCARVGAVPAGPSARRRSRFDHRRKAWPKHWRYQHPSDAGGWVEPASRLRRIFATSSISGGRPVSWSPTLGVASSAGSRGRCSAPRGRHLTHCLSAPACFGGAAALSRPQRSRLLTTGQR